MNPPGGRQNVFSLDLIDDIYRIVRRDAAPEPLLCCGIAVFTRHLLPAVSRQGGPYARPLDLPRCQFLPAHQAK